MPMRICVRSCGPRRQNRPRNSTLPTSTRPTPDWCAPPLLAPSHSCPLPTPPPPSQSNPPQETPVAHSLHRRLAPSLPAALLRLGAACSCDRLLCLRLCEPCPSRRRFAWRRQVAKARAHRAVLKFASAQPAGISTAAARSTRQRMWRKADSRLRGASAERALCERSVWGREVVLAASSNSIFLAPWRRTWLCSSRGSMGGARFGAHVGAHVGFICLT